MKKVVYGIDIKRVMRSKLVLGIADGWLSADGNVIYRASDLKVGLFRRTRRCAERRPDRGCGLARTARLHGRPIAARSDDRPHDDRKRDEASMRRVVVTGMGIVSSIGNNTQEVLASLREAKSGIVARRKIRRARLPLPGAWRADARSRRSRSTAARCASSAAARPGTTSPWSRRSATPALEENEISNERTGIIMGSGGPSTRADRRSRRHHAQQRVPKRVGPFAVPKAMSSTASATLATWFKIKGVNYSISSACATSNHCIGNAAGDRSSGASRT